MKKNKGFYFLAFFILLGIILTDLFGGISFAKSLIWQGAYKSSEPVSYLKTGINSAFRLVMDISSLDQENKRLTKENLELIEENVEMKKNKKENEELRNALAIPNIRGKNKLFVDIFSNVLQGEQGVFFIGKGSKDGIKKDQVIIDANSYFVGKITEVENKWAKGVFAPYLNAELPVSIAGKDIKGIINIKSQGWELDMAPKNTNLEPGDILLLDGEEGILESGNASVAIIMGRLTELTSQEKDLFSKGNVEPLLNYAQIYQGFVLTEE